MRCSRGALSCPEDDFANHAFLRFMYRLPCRLCRRHEGEASGDVSIWRADMLEDWPVVLEPPEA